MANEVPSVDRVEDAVQRATVLKRVDPDEPSETVKNMPDQFGNNFYLLFKAIRLSASRPDRPIVQIYLKKAEALGEPWQRFLSENVRLLAELNEVLAEEDIYADVLQIYRDFCFTGDIDDVDAYDLRFDPKGINAIGIPIWRRLNALLQQASEAMKQVGIDPTKFYG